MYQPVDRRSQLSQYGPVTAVAIGLVLILVTLVPVLATQQGAQVPMAPPELQGRPTNIVLALDSLGAPSINHQPVPWNQLDRELLAIYSLRPEKYLFIKAHPRNDYRTVLRVVEMARRRRITVYLLPWIS